MAADDLTKKKKQQLHWAKERKHWRIGKTFPGLMNPGSCCFTLMGGLGYGENHEYMDPSYCVSTLQAGVVIVWGVFMAHIGSLDKSGATFECHRISEHHCQSGAAVYPSVNVFFSTE